MRLEVRHPGFAQFAAADRAGATGIGQQLLVGLELVGGGFQPRTLGALVAERINLTLFLVAQRGQLRLVARKLRGGSAGGRQLLPPAHLVGKLLVEATQRALLLVALPLAARPVEAEFTNSAADARSFQPLRLTVDLGGRERQVQLALEFPSGGRIAPDLGQFTAGSRSHVQVLKVYVPSGTAAGTFTVRGNVIDGSRRWPFEATLRVRANPKLSVIDEEAGATIVRAAETIHRTWRVTNSGNVVLDLRTSAQPTAGTLLTVEPGTLTLAPGETREIVLTARLEQPFDRLVTLPLFLNVDSGRGSLQRRETVVFTAEFVPLEAGTGPLFAELSGEVLAGGVIARDHRGPAGRMRLAGEVMPGVSLLADGADGTAAPGGSRLGLATRDFRTVDLGGKTWRTTGGLVDPPSFGFLESSTQGRGGTLAWSGDPGLTLTALKAREHFGDFSREHAGVHVMQMAPDKSGWEAGVLAQRNQFGATPVQERLGGFAQTNWLWHGLAGASQVAAAQDTSTKVARLGVEQRLDYRTADERSSASVFVQNAPAGFFLDGRSQELRDASVAVGVGATSRLNLRWSESRQQGLLRSYLQTETEAGLIPTDPKFVELITRSGSQVRSQSAGFEFAPGDSRARVTLSDTRRTRDASLVQQHEDEYREHAVTSDWSRGFWEGQLLLTTSLAGGTEENLTQQANFAEAAFTASGNLGAHLQFTTELRRTWHAGGSENAGYRQTGTYGRGSLLWTPYPRWRVETGLDAYQFSHFAGRTRSYAVLEAPLTPRVALATEVSHDNERTSFWLAARVNFKTQMPWRPVRGALAGRIREAAGRPVAGARLDLDGRTGLSDAEGRFALPSRRPGSYPLNWSLPPEYTAAADWPRTVQIRAGQLQTVELAVQRLGVLSGTVEITRDGEVLRPTGSISATDVNGQIFETVAATGDFKLLLPPGRYTVRYTGELSPALAAPLVATVEVGEAGAPATIHLAVEEKARGMRRTFFQDDKAPPKEPIGP